MCSFIATVKAPKTLSERFLYHNETHFLKYLCFLNNYSNMREEKNFSTIIFSFANVRYKFYNYFFILKIKNDSRSYLWRWVFSCLWSSQRIRDQCSSERIVEPQRRHPWNEERSLNSPNRIQDLEERTIKLTKSDTINPLTSSTHNCSPNFVKRVRMYVYLASSNDWNILEYRRRLELCRLHYQYDCAI